ncbi:MAG TPA: hypothetical protein VMS21_06190, partial [Methylomirabilota bacterium]|nr:hypothetical protein [Methylomirabilota bacterium]
MIVPSFRLLLWTAVWVVPFGGLAGMIPELALPGVALAGGFGLLVAADAIRGLRIRGGISVEVEPVIRLAKDRPGEVGMELAGSGNRPQRLRVGLGLPKVLLPDCDAQRVEVPAHPARLRLDWGCVPLERGT